MASFCLSHCRRADGWPIRTCGSSATGSDTPPSNSWIMQSRLAAGPPAIMGKAPMAACGRRTLFPASPAIF